MGKFIRISVVFRILGSKPDFSQLFLIKTINWLILIKTKNIKFPDRKENPGKFQNL